LIVEQRLAYLVIVLVLLLVIDPMSAAIFEHENESR
jgi:hypothetical protein